MACEGFEKSLIEEALASTDPALLAHLRKCGACRAELAAQRDLQERITSGIAAMAADEPSPAFLMRVRARIAEESAPRSIKWMQWAAAGMAVAAVAAVALWFIGRPLNRPQAPDGKSVQSVKNPSSSAAKPPQIAASRQPEQIKPAGGHKHAPSRHDARGDIAALYSNVVEAPQSVVTVRANAAHGQIIVPTGQREAVLRLVDALRTGRVDAASLLRAGQQGDGAPLAIAPIVVKPVNGGDEDDGQEQQLENEF